MPLSKVGLKIRRNFQKEYGKKRGTRFFYAWEHEHKRIIRREF